MMIILEKSVCPLDDIRDLSPGQEITWKKNFLKCDSLARGCCNQGRKALHQGNESQSDKWVEVASANAKRYTWFRPSRSVLQVRLILDVNC